MGDWRSTAPIALHGDSLGGHCKFVRLVCDLNNVVAGKSLARLIRQKNVAGTAAKTMFTFIYKGYSGNG